MAALQPQDVASSGDDDAYWNNLYLAEAAARQERLTRLRLEAETKTILLQKKLIETYSGLCHNGVMEADARRMFKTNIVRIGTALMALGEPDLLHLAEINRFNSHVNETVSIGALVAAMGHHNFSDADMKDLRGAMTAAFHRTHNQEE